MSAHMEGHDENLPFWTQIQSLWMSDSHDGVSNALAASHALCLFAPHSGRSGWL
jgi:uncharacterized membrane protein